jgi:hypothetical protein
MWENLTRGSSVRTNQAVRSTPNLVDKPERIGPALAQVVRQDDSGRDAIVGQAWLAAPNRLVTCGHVIEPYLQNLGGTFVYFPATGRRYPVLQARLHPSFVRQPDGLVKFDVAVLTVQLAAPDSQAQPLPFSYETSLRTNQPLWTIRFPAHLGHLSAAVQPLSQDGRFLGLLRKHDSFHLLHDVQLSPGDSGAPLTDGRNVVAIHCGDTATLPGLNLPTTSIRLALWVDALRELDLAETRKSYISRTSRLVSAAIAFFVMAAIGFGAGTALLSKPQSKPTPLKQPAMMPLLIKFNKAFNHYSVKEAIELTLDPTSPIYPFVFVVSEEGFVAQIYPPIGVLEKIDTSVTIDQAKQVGTARPMQLEASASPMKLYVLSVKADGGDGTDFAKGLIKAGEFHPSNTGVLMIKDDALLARIKEFEKAHPDLVALTKFDMPAAK